MPQTLPAHPNLDWLKRTAKEGLAELRASDPASKLHQAQLLVARDYGFKSWRELKTRINDLWDARVERARAFEAARVGNVDAVRRAVASGFDLATQDVDGRTIYQIAKELGHAALEVLARDEQQSSKLPERDASAVRAILSAAQSGKVSELAALLDARPELINAKGGGLKKATALHLAALRNHHAAMRLLIERGADLDPRDFPDNATPLHFAAVDGDLETIRLLVEASADVDGIGDDYEVGVLGWATCFRHLREDVAADLAATIRKLARHLRPTGIVAFQELYLSAATAIPDGPVFAQYLNWISELFVHEGSRSTWVRSFCHVPQSGPAGPQDVWGDADLEQRRPARRSL